MFGHRHHDTDTMHDTDRVRDESVTGRHEAPLRTPYDDEAAHDRYGGLNAGADFFGWLVAVATTVLLTGVLGAIAAAVSNEADVTQSAVEREAGTIGIVAAIVLVLVTAVGYFAGGYVAGRMSRFDGARQGFGVWLIGVLVMGIAAGLGLLFGEQYNVLDRVDLPQLPISDAEAGIGALVTGAVVLVVTLVAALAGGKLGRDYHKKVDAVRVM